MAKINKKSKSSKVDNKYNADNEIIIGVTTKANEKVRVEKKTARTNKKKKDGTSIKKNQNSKKNTTVHKKNHTNNSNINSKTIDRKDEVQIKKINRRKVAISIIILLIIALGGVVYYLTTPVFNVSDIQVIGGSKNTNDTYISLSKINIGNTNIFAFTSSGVKKNIKENPYVEEVIVKRKFPSTVELYITERVVAYQAEYLGKYMYLNNQGYVLEISEEKLSLPLIIGLDSLKENIKIGTRLSNDDLIKLDVVVKISNYCKYNNVESEITSIDTSNTADYIVYFEKEKKKVYLGNSSNLVEKMDSAVTIMRKEKNESREIFVREDLLERNRTYSREMK